MRARGVAATNSWTRSRVGRPAAPERAVRNADLTRASTGRACDGPSRIIDARRSIAERGGSGTILLARLSFPSFVKTGTSPGSSFTRSTCMSAPSGQFERQPVCAAGREAKVKRPRARRFRGLKRGVALGQRRRSVNDSHRRPPPLLQREVQGVRPAGRCAAPDLAAAAWRGSGRHRRARTPPREHPRSMRAHSPTMRTSARCTRSRRSSRAGRSLGNKADTARAALFDSAHRADRKDACLARRVGGTAGSSSRGDRAREHLEASRGSTARPASVAHSSRPSPITVSRQVK